MAGVYFYVALVMLGVAALVYSVVTMQFNMLIFGIVCVLVSGFAVITLREDLTDASDKD